MIRSLLIANRGEIAVRIVRAARERGIRAIAVYSEPERLAPHVLEADEAYLIGPAASSESYLCAVRLIEGAEASGADAIHPGYGFLAERSFFAKAVRDAGLVFVGPSPEVIAVMGDKTEARRYMKNVGVPIIPGVTEPVSNVEAALAAAHTIGFPVLVKAAAGGGGKGMRKVQDAHDLEAAFEAAEREALSAFGDGTLYLERALERPRHIEVQILADMQGNIVHLGERECSIQRRHQKLIEESPAPALSKRERLSIGQTAVQAARAIDYEGAGTVEFLYEDGKYYFLEMNTRIQVEHPVTELVTGIDIVDWQIRIASGEPLDFTQDDVQLSGHAIECRITAEDPLTGFLPCTGTVDRLQVPTGPGAMALDECLLVGLDNSASFHRRVMDEPDFVEGHLSIRYLEEHPELLQKSDSDPNDFRLIAIAAALLELHEGRQTRISQVTPEMSRWKSEWWPWKSAKD